MPEWCATYDESGRNRWIMAEHSVKKPVVDLERSRAWGSSNRKTVISQPLIHHYQGSNGVTVPQVTAKIIDRQNLRTESKLTMSVVPTIYSSVHWQACSHRCQAWSSRNLTDWNSDFQLWVTLLLCPDDQRRRVWRHTVQWLKFIWLQPATQPNNRELWSGVSFHLISKIFRLLSVGIVTTNIKFSMKIIELQLKLRVELYHSNGEYWLSYCEYANYGLATCFGDASGEMSCGSIPCFLATCNDCRYGLRSINAVFRHI